MACNILSCAFPCCMGQLRFMVAFMAIVGIIIAYCHRVVLNIAIVEMVTLTGTSDGGKPTCPIPPGQKTAVISNIGGGKVDWDGDTQNTIILAFFPGYMVTHVPGGIACDKWGSRLFLIIAFAISSLCTAAIPWVAVNTPWWCIFILRIVTGGAQGVLYPAFSSIISRWIPPNERATIGAITLGANSFGLVVGNFCTGLLIDMVQDWRIPYYMWGVVGGVYTILLFGYVFSDPRTSPFITDVEMSFMQDTMVFKQPMGIPLLKVLIDPCIWGLAFTQVGHDFIIFALSNNLPKYMNNVLGFDIKNNALVSFMFLLGWFSSFFTGKIADWMVKKKNANVSWMRKVYTIISNVLSGVFLCAAGWFKCDYTLVLCCFAAGIFMKGIFFAGGKVNIIDVSLNHSALVMSVVNGIGALAGMGCTGLIKSIAKNNTHAEWDLVFLTFLGIEVVTSFLYCCLSSADRRKWDYPEGEERPIKKKKKWYVQMTPSDNALRLERDKKAEDTRRENAKIAKEKMRQAIIDERAKKAAAKK